MMINGFTVRKWTALLIAGFLPALNFYISLVFVKHKYNFFISLGVLMFTLIISLLIGNMLLNNPFRKMVEGKGLLAVDINSTGILQFFNVGLDVPYIKGKLKGKEINDIFDRSTVMQIAPPIDVKDVAKQTENGLIFTISKDEYNKARMMYNTYPVLIYNSQIRSLLTKDMLADMEKTTFTEHTVIYLNRKVEELTSVVRDFGRYVVELTKPKTSLLSGKAWVWIIIIGLIILFAFLFGPKIIAMLKGTSTQATTTVKEALGSTQAVIRGG